MILAFENMTEDRLDQVLTIEEEAFTSPWSRESMEAELKNKLAVYEVMTIDDELVGYYGFWKVFDEGHIMNIAVKKDYRGRGLGKILFSRLVDRAKEEGVLELSLEVRRSNKEARGLYESFSFEVVGERKDYYAKGEDAILMRKYI